MRRRVPLYLAVDRSVFSSGLQPDLHPVHKLLWEVAENVTFFSGKVKRRIAAAQVHQQNSGTPVRGISQQQDTNGTRWLWIAHQDSLITRWYGPAPEGVFNVNVLQQNESSTAPAGFVDFTHYGDWTLVNSGAGQAKLYKPTSGVAPLGNCPSTVTQFLKKLNFMMAFGYGARGTRVGWSDADNISEWTATATNLAGALTIDDFDTAIKAAKPLGTSIAVYNEDQMALVNYIGGLNVFGFKFALDGIGASGKFSVASAGSSHYGVGRGGIWWTDGLSYKYIDEGYLHDYLQDVVTWGQQSKITAVRNDYTGCFEFAFPVRGSLECNEAWSYDPRTGGWSSIPYFSIKDERRLFQKPILGTSDGRVMRDEDNPLVDAPLALTTKPMMMQGGNDSMGLTNAQVASKVDEVVLLFKEVLGVEFRLGASHDLAQPFAWSPWQACVGQGSTYDIGSTPADGVYFKLQFRSVVVDWKMDFQGFMLYGIVEGTKRDVA